MTLRSSLSANLAFLLVMALTVLGIGGGTAHIIQRLQTTAIAEALDQSALHARAFEDHLSRSLNTVASLGDLVAAGPIDLTSDTIGDLFHRTLRHAPFLRSLSVLDEDGRIIASSNPANVGFRINTGGYLPAASANPEYLRIGRPWSGRDFNEGEASSTAQPVAAGDSISFRCCIAPCWMASGSRCWPRSIPISSSTISISGWIPRRGLSNCCAMI